MFDCCFLKLKAWLYPSHQYYFFYRPKKDDLGLANVWKSQVCGLALFCIIKASFFIFTDMFANWTCSFAFWPLIHMLTAYLFTKTDFLNMTSLQNSNFCASWIFFSGVWIIVGTDLIAPCWNSILVQVFISFAFSCVQT